MIFLSHNYKDKDIVGPIAVQLAAKYGRDNVFYDSWSIRPGDGIIAEMNNGLEKCRYFFFFVSQNSLASGMVSLEWQAALHKSVNTDMRFIPIKVDNSNQPIILKDKLYIDMYNEGMQQTLLRIIDVIENKISTPYAATFENIICEISKVTAAEYRIGVFSLKFVVHSPNIAVSFQNQIGDIEFKPTGAPGQTSFSSVYLTSSGMIDGDNCRGVSISSNNLTPNQPFYFLVKSKSDSAIINLRVWHSDGNTAKLIPQKG
jgi:hypothetical protein